MNFLKHKTSRHKLSTEDRKLKETIPFDPEKQHAIIRASICSGEQVAGFKADAGGHFTEVMLIRTPEDLERFKRIYELTDIKTEY